MSTLPISLQSGPSIRTLVFVLGKVCLFFGIGVALSLGDMWRKYQNRELPSLEFDDVEVSSNSNEQTNLENYKVITQRNIFGIVQTKAAPPKPAPKKTTLKLRLVGTHLGGGGTPFAIIENTSKKEQDIFDLNQTVFGQAKLVEVLPESIKLDHNGKIETLVLEEGKGGSKGGGAPGSSSVSGDGTDFSISEEELSNALANLPRLLSQARAVPYFRNGESIGMRLFAIRRGSLYEKLGLKNGDIIRSVNDNSLSDPSQALKIFEQLKNESSVSVKLERGGQQKSLRYSIQ